MSAEALVDQAMVALMRVVDPCSIATGLPISLPDMGMVKGVTVENGGVTVTLILTSPICWQVGNIVEAVEVAISAIPGVKSVRCAVDHDADWLPSLMEPGVRRQLRAIRPGRSSSNGGGNRPPASDPRITVQAGAWSPRQSEKLL